MDIFLEKIEVLLVELGFQKVIVNGVLLFFYSGYYYKMTYIEGLKSFVIEYADSYDSVEKNIFEDGDLYPISLGEDDLINKLRHDLVHYYITD